MRNPALPARVERFTTGNVTLTEKQVAAQNAGKLPLARQYADSIQTLMVAVDEASYPQLRKACGRPPRRPRPRRRRRVGRAHALRRRRRA
jgi:hypothetical protein